MSYFPQPPTTYNVSAEKAKEHLTVSAFGPVGVGEVDKAPLLMLEVQG